MLPGQFTYPFCYTPHPLIVEAAQCLIRRIDASDELRSIFAEGKMLGALLVANGEETECLYAFSGVAGGHSVIDGFVPPIYDWTDPQGHFRRREAEISVLNATIAVADNDEATALKERRRQMSVELQEWLFDQYVVLNALGERRTIRSIFAERNLTPPGGTGDCAAPKLLQYAYLHGHKPLAMGEFWYGASPSREVRRHGCFYPSCTGKCGPLLSYMLQGLDVEPNPLEADGASWVDGMVLYSDETLIVVDKPSGMLSVPGRTGAKSMVDWLQKRFGAPVYSCHRLDMDTSGVMVYARTLAAKSSLEHQFASREVSKTYVARLLKGDVPWECAAGASEPFVPMKGRVELPLALDYYDRPRQMVDSSEGKPSVTEYEVVEVFPDGEALVRFRPKTGRSHQIRVHAAHALGLGRPVKGDRLYGDPSPEQRLCLHSESLTFRHPVSGEMMSFSSPASF